MATVVKKFNLEVVQESSKRYNIDKTITSSVSAGVALKEIFRLDKQAEEVLVMFCLDTKNKIVGAFEVSRGSLNSSIASPREIFKRALTMNSARIIVAHNHPSGNTEESSADINTTERMIECGKLLGIELLDHFIVGGGNGEVVSLNGKYPFMFKK